MEHVMIRMQRLRGRLAIGAMVGLGTCAVIATATSTASATPCGSSTPATTTAYDSPSDGDAGLAPEISAMTIAVDGSCNITVALTLDAYLIYGDSHIIYVDTDGNPGTGDSTFVGADVAVITVGRSGVDDSPVMETWNGTGWTVGPQLTPAANSWGFTTRLDTLGIANPTTITAQAGSMYRGLYSNYFDFIPDPGLPPIPLSVAFAAPAPPPPPAPAAPAASAPVAPAAPSAACTTAKAALGSVTATIITTQRQRAKAKTPAARKKANARLKALAARKKMAAADVAIACAT